MKDCLFRHTILFKMGSWKCNPNALKAFCASAQAANFRVAFLHSKDKEDQQFAKEVARLAEQESEYTPHLNNVEKLKSLSQELNQEEQEWQASHPLIIKDEQMEVNKGLDEYESRFNQFEHEHPYFSRVEAKIDGVCMLF